MFFIFFLLVFISFPFLSPFFPISTLLFPSFFYLLHLPFLHFLSIFYNPFFSFSLFPLSICPFSPFPPLLHSLLCLPFPSYVPPPPPQRSCFTAKMEPPVPRWRSLILPYQTETWLAFLGALAVCGCVLYLLFLLTRFR